MIVMLSMSFLNLQATDSIPYLYGRAVVTIPVDAIRVANAKIIERNYLALINSQKDSIIDSQSHIVARLDTMYDNVAQRYTLANDNLKTANNKLKQTKIVSASIILALLIGLIIK